MKNIPMMFFLALVMLLQNCDAKPEDEKPIAENVDTVDSKLSIQESTDSLYERVKSHLSEFKKVTKEISETSEGGEVVGFFQGGKLRLIQIENYGDMGRTATEYLFENDEVIFILKIEQYYDMPFYMEGSKVEKELKHKYYLKNNNLLKWIDDKGEVVAEGYYAKQMKLFNEQISKYSKLLTGK